MKYQFETKTAKVYILRNAETNAGTCSWADITIREWSSGGSIDIQSDFGDFSYMWGSIGHDRFIEFLIGLDYHYAMGKFRANRGRGYKFDPEAAYRQIKSDIIDRRKHDGIDKAFALDLWDSLEHSDLNDSMLSEEALFHLMPDNISKYVYGCDYSSYPTPKRKDPQCAAFWDIVWPCACDVWRKELEAAKEAENGV